MSIDPLLSDVPLLAGLFTGALLISACALKPLIGWLRRRAVMDFPNERSSHSVPTPRGGGLVVAPVVLAAWAIADPGAGTAVLLGLAGVLGLVSWIDDVRGLGAAPRMLVQALLITAALYFDPVAAPLFLSFIPERLWFFLVAAAWLWFVNLFNFMDGIDGITGVETASVALGLLVLIAAAPPLLPLGGPAAALIGAAAGFLVWNWPPAKIFLGDAGSTVLGFLLGALLLELVRGGMTAAAFILPAYYVTDATITLLRRLLRGKKIWRAHREHAYQRAVRRGLSHARVSAAVAILNIVLIILAFWSIKSPLFGALAAYGLSLALYAYLLRGARWRSGREA